MAFADQLRDRATLQQSVLTDDGKGSGTEVWTNRLSFACSARQMSTRALITYGRTGTENGIVFSADDQIPRTQGKNSFFDLLDEPDQRAYRIVHNGRTMTVLGPNRPSQGMHSTMANVLLINTVEAPERVGSLDAP